MWIYSAWSGLGRGWAPSANAFIGQNLWEHYKFTDDKQYLQEKDLSDTERSGGVS
ncbi:glycosyl hydrolase family 95 catalytic domain-containing protein [Bacillus cereus]